MEKNKIRNGIKDIWWQSRLVDGATFKLHDIPYCPTKISSIPKGMITYEEARSLVYRNKKNGLNDYVIDLFVCFYVDDYKFDSTQGIWFNPTKAYDILKHFKGIITPDFSTHIDFPKPLKCWNIFRERAFGYWWGNVDGGKYEVIPNVRGDETILDIAFEGLDKNSIISIGTVGSSLRELKNQDRFNKWIYKMYEKLKPTTILVYGTSNYPCFVNLKKLGVNIITYPSRTATSFKNEVIHE